MTPANVTASSMPLEGMRALVTGAGMGIGAAIARVFLEAGADVGIHCHSHEQDAEATAAQWRTVGRNAFTLPADLQEPAAVLRVVDSAVERLGGLDILVNNAGVTQSRWLAEEEIGGIERLFRLNVAAPYYACQRALGPLTESGRGSVINLTSILGALGFPGSSAYAATKGALISLTKQLAIELAPARIRVNAIGPGLIEVPRYFDVPGYSSETGHRVVPIGRIGYPDDIAAAAVFLASPAASFITGAVLWVDGGQTAGLSLNWPEVEPAPRR